MTIANAIQKIIWPLRTQNAAPSLKVPEQVPVPFHYVENREDFIRATQGKTSGVIWPANHHLTLGRFLDNKTADEMRSLTITFADVTVTRENGIVTGINLVEPDDVPTGHRNIDQLKATPIWNPLIRVATLHAETSNKNTFFLRALNPSNTKWHDHFASTTTCAFRGAGSDLRRNTQEEINTNTGDVVHIPSGLGHRSPPNERFQSSRYIITCGG